MIKSNMTTVPQCQLIIGLPLITVVVFNTFEIYSIKFMVAWWHRGPIMGISIYLMVQFSINYATHSHYVIGETYNLRNQ